MRIKLILKEGYVSDQFKQDPEKMRALDDAKAGDQEAKSSVKKMAQRAGRKDSSEKGKLEKLVKFCESEIFPSREKRERDISATMSRGGREVRFLDMEFRNNEANLKYLPYVIRELEKRHPEATEDDSILMSFWNIFRNNVRFMQEKTVKNLLSIYLNSRDGYFSEYFKTHRSSFFGILNVLNVPENISEDDLMELLWTH